MKKIFFIGCIINLMLVTSTCKPKEQANAANSNQVSIENEDSKNSLNWEGTYMGIIPCANCSGILVRIRLFSDGIYKMDYQYMEKEPNKETFEGTFQWSAEKNVITLDNLDKSAFPVYYKVDENSITQLDLNGHEITGQDAVNYVLAKINANLTGKLWKLTEIMGKPAPKTEDAKSAYITFNDEDNQVSGNSGCNSFSGTYQLSPENKIAFSAMVATRMMCANMEIENKLNSIFPAIDSYTISENTLCLNESATTTLARFTAE
jgi:heat shock protein HslJ